VPILNEIIEDSVAKTIEMTATLEKKKAKFKASQNIVEEVKIPDPSKSNVVLK